MKKAIQSGLSFGLTSGVITTLGLMMGLYFSTNSKLVVIGGILTIAFADAFSDALGIHISKESEKGTRAKQIWQATFSSFSAKLIIAPTFLIPVFLFPLKIAITISIAYGLFLISWLSFKIAKYEKHNPKKVIKEHLFITIIVIILSTLIGKSISMIFGN
jgi:VIT1/CCC1 family predicted Fe2+/Mn2+ transporter